MEVIQKALRLSTTLHPHNTGIIFFGGEPLLRKDLIKKTITICRKLEQKLGYSYHFKVTTNGLLLDRPFLEYATKARLQIALSIDGEEEAHNYFRRTTKGKDTFAKIDGIIDDLLSNQPYSYALMTVCPETLHFYSQSVEYLINRGFRYIIASLNYAGNWQDNHLKLLKQEYKNLARLYEKLTLAKRKFYFSPFEKKLASHIQGPATLCQQCHFGIKQISIAPDGSIYPCVQFVKDGKSNKDFCIGDVTNGIDQNKQQRLFHLSREENTECISCKLRHRCEHQCSCLNWQTTGEINQITPFLCESERILIPIADNLGEKLFRKKAHSFMQKHYNPAAPFISFLEDQQQ